LREQKNALKPKNHFLKNIKKGGLNKFLGHIFPVVDDASGPPEHRDAWASLKLFCEFLAAQMVGYVSC
jgi:hypothetical protein